MLLLLLRVRTVEPCAVAHFRRQNFHNPPELSFGFFSIAFDSLNVTHVVFVWCPFADQPEENKRKKKFQHKKCKDPEMNHKTFVKSKI